MIHARDSIKNNINWIWLKIISLDERSLNVHLKCVLIYKRIIKKLIINYKYFDYYMMKIALIFPGQGSQYIGMGKTLCAKYKIAKKTFNEASKVCGFDVLKFSSSSTYFELINSEKALPVLLTATVAAFRVFNEAIKLEPKYFAGYSFGELSALVCSESISFSDALKISLRKGTIIREVAKKEKSAMLSVDGVNIKNVDKICKKLSTKKEFINIALYNSNRSCVVSGSIKLIEKFEESIKGKNLELNRLEIEAPFHSLYFKKASIDSKEELREYTIKIPEIPVISSLSAKVLKGKNEIINSISDHLVKPVLWSKTLDYLINKKVEVIIEIGPKKILTSSIKKLNKFKRYYSFSSPNDILAIKNDFILSKDDFLGIMSRCMGAAMSVGNFNNDSDDYNKKVVEPYGKMKSKLNYFRSNKKNPSFEDIIFYFNMLKNILLGKKIGKREIEAIALSVYIENGKLEYIKELNNVWKIVKKE